LNVSPLGMGLINGLVWIVTASFVGKEFKMKAASFALGMAMPMAVFFFIPYSESLFALGITLILIGLNRSKLTQILLGIFICSITRPTILVLVPAVILGLLFFQSLLPKARSIFWTVLTAIAGLFVVLLIQRMDTGSWTSFIEAQQAWGNSLSWPQWPLRTWGQGINLILDGTALWFGLLSGVSFFLLLREEDASPKNSPTLMALSFVAGTCLLVLFTRGGFLFSLSRFVFASPLILLVVHRLISIKPTKKSLAWMATSIVLFGIALGAYEHIITWLQFLAVGAFVTGSWIIWNKNRPILKWLVIALMLGLQGYVCSLFLFGDWIA
jgi:hypothetical protein